MLIDASQGAFVLAYCRVWPPKTTQKTIEEKFRAREIDSVPVVEKSPCEADP